MRKIVTVTALMGLAMLAGCKYEGSGVQRQYMADRTDCRSYAEHTVGGQAAPSQDMQLHLVSQFANCMHKRGWAVNKPPES